MATQTKTTGRDSDKFMLRLPDGMRDRLRDNAAKNGRTMNAEVIAELEKALGAGEVQRAAAGMAGAIEQLTLWLRLRALSEQVLRMREIQHTPDEFMRLVAKMEQEARRVIEQTAGIDQTTTEVVDNVTNALTKLAKFTEGAGRKRATRPKPS